MSEYQNLRSTEAGYTMEEEQIGLTQKIPRCPRRASLFRYGIGRPGGSAQELGDRTCKDRVRNLLENPNSGLGAQAIHYFLMLVILVSTLCVIIETVPSVSGSPVFLPAEMCFTALFTAEFALRLYASESFTEFIANPFNIVDFLAVFPGYMSLLGVMLRQDDQKNSFAHLGKATKSMRSLRMVRIVRLVRVFRVMRICKVARHSEVLFLTFMVFLKVSQSGLFLVLMLIGFAMARTPIGMPPDGDAEEGTGPGLAGLERTVHQSAVFHECSYEFVEAIMLHIRKILLHPEKVLVKEEDNVPRSMYFVLFGNLDLFRLGKFIGTISSGQVIGEGVLLGILDSWSCTAVARNSCMLAEITSSALIEVLQEHPEESEYFDALSASELQGGLQELEPQELRRSLRRMPCLRQASEEFLEALEQGLVHQLYFAEQCIVNEGQDSNFAAFLGDGEVTIEAAGRQVRREEVPFVEMCFTMAGEADQGNLRFATVDSEAAADWIALGEGVDVESLISMTNKVRAEAMIAEAVADGLTPGYDINTLPETGIFGEEIAQRGPRAARGGSCCPCRTGPCRRECLLGLGMASTTVRASKLSIVALLYRPVFEKLLQEFPLERKSLKRFQLGPFPKPNFRDRGNCRCSRRDYIEPESLQLFLPKHLLNPVVNITYAIVQVGHVRVMTPPGLELAPFGHLSSGDILGPGSILPGSWFWSSVKVQALQICFVTEMPKEREKVLPLLVRESSNPNAAQQVPRSSERVAKVLRERSIFAHASQEFLAEILNYGSVRVFMPGDRIIQQGAEGNSMFILSLGLAQVVKENLDYAGNNLCTRLQALAKQKSDEAAAVEKLKSDVTAKGGIAMEASEKAEAATEAMEEAEPWTTESKLAAEEAQAELVEAKAEAAEQKFLDAKGSLEKTLQVASLVEVRESVQAFYDAIDKSTKSMEKEYEATEGQQDAKPAHEPGTAERFTAVVVDFYTFVADSVGEIHENAEAALQLQCDPTEEPQTTPHNPPREPMQRAVFFGGELERAAKKSKDKTDFFQKCGSGVWKDLKLEQQRFPHLEKGAIRADTVVKEEPKAEERGRRAERASQDYGKDIDAEYSYIRALQEAREQEEAARMRPLVEDERKDLIEGLKSKWEQVNTAYQGATHITKLDTMGKMKRKEI
eukprot:g8139.t1